MFSKLLYRELSNLKTGRTWCWELLSDTDRHVKHVSVEVSRKGHRTRKLIVLPMLLRQFPLAQSI